MLSGELAHKITFIIIIIVDSCIISIILRKSKAMPSPAEHFYHIVNEIPVSNCKQLQRNRF